MKIFQKKEPVKIVEDTNIVLLYHPSVVNDASAVYEMLKRIIPVNFHSTDFLNEAENREKIQKADLVLVFFNYDYALDEFCRRDFANLKGKSEVLKINLAAEAYLPPDLIGQFRMDKERCVEFHEDFQKQYLSGKGKLFTELITKMKHILPRPFVIEKKIDITVVGTEEDARKMKEKKEYAGMKIESLAPSGDIEPNFELINDTKLMLVILTEPVNSNENAIEELKYSKLMKTDMIIVQDKALKNANPAVESIKGANRPENNFASLEVIAKGDFAEKVKENVRQVEQRQVMLTEIAEAVKQESALDPSDKVIRPQMDLIPVDEVFKETKT